MSDYTQIKKELESLIKGEIFDDKETLKKYSRDASLFEVLPKLVIWPKDSEDIKSIVKFVSSNKSKYKDLSITARAAGSCMSGGSLNESIILDFTKYINYFSVDPENKTAIVEPGVFYRDFEPETLKHNLILPCYTASKNLCALGGMIGNNCAGEKTLQYGKMENYVEEISVILDDGEEYVFKNTLRVDAIKKSHEHTKEGYIYEKMMPLLEDNEDCIQSAKPKVSKNSAGYYLWNIQNKDGFDMTKILVGSQGTLGIITRAKIKLVEKKSLSNLFVIFMNSIENLGNVVNTILKYNPESLESYDDSTMKLAVRFMPEMMKIMKGNFIKLALSFLPEAYMTLTGGLPKLILLVEFSGNSDLEINKNILALEEDIKKFNLKTRKTKNMKEAEKYWTVRRESFNLLRKHIKGKRTAPFIDDVCVEPKHLPQFLPRLRKILDDSKLLYTIAGHAGNGNFHIIPLMNMNEKANRQLISIVSEKVYDLVAQYDGSITAEHNDGIIRTPYLNKMYSPEILDLFYKTKEIFDPQNIFNPGKKVKESEDGIGSVEYMISHLAHD